MPICQTSPVRPVAIHDKKQSGFTLVEASVVLLIIGLLSSGILKGQELINSAKTKQLAHDLQAVQIALYGYQDRFKGVPGDFAAASTVDARAGVATTPPGLLGNGRIDGVWNSTTGTDESRLFWQHVRLAGFLAGPVNVAAVDYTHTSTFGSMVGISSTFQITLPTAMSGTHNICTGDIPGRFARQLDVQIDDGNTETGAVRVSETATPEIARSPASIDDGGKYVVCFAF